MVFKSVAKAFLSLSGTYFRVLTIHVGDNESSKYWLSVLNELKNRGVKDILILCADGLTPLIEGVRSVQLGIKEWNAAKEYVDAHESK